MSIAENKLGTNNEWCTPREVWEPIIETFGEIALDPCGNPDQSVPAKTVHLLDSYSHPWGTGTYIKCISVPDDFSTSWASNGLVFINGPWSHCKKTVPKVFDECAESIQLLPARTSAVWWQNYVWPCPYICFWYGRMHFEGATYNAPFHNALVYNGPRPQLFKETFHAKGHFIRNF